MPVFYGWETWSLAKREGHRFSMLDSKVLRIISGTHKGGNGSTFVRVVFV
jgi:hypothetical protein